MLVAKYISSLNLILNYFYIMTIKFILFVYICVFIDISLCENEIFSNLRTEHTTCYNIDPNCDPSIRYCQQTCFTQIDYDMDSIIGIIVAVMSLLLFICIFCIFLFICCGGFEKYGSSIPVVFAYT